MNVAALFELACDHPLLIAAAAWIGLALALAALWSWLMRGRA